MCNKDNILVSLASQCMINVYCYYYDQLLNRLSADVKANNTISHQIINMRCIEKKYIQINFMVHID